MVPFRGPCSFASLVVLLGCCACSGGDEASDDQSGGNVDFSSMCSIPAACGGDPTGRWDVVAGCVQPSAEDYDCNWREMAEGDVSGTVSFEGGSYSIDLQANLSHCGTIDFSVNGLGGTYAIMGTEIVASSTTFAFCVDGDTMSLWDRAASSPDMSVLELVRSGG